MRWLRDFTNRPVCASRSHPALGRRGSAQRQPEIAEPAQRDGQAVTGPSFPSAAGRGPEIRIAPILQAVWPWLLGDTAHAMLSWKCVKETNRAAARAIQFEIEHFAAPS
jgi:hypothetical protein